jgi:glycogenin glucosyltransferase
MNFKNPAEKLDELRRSSVTEFEHLKQPNHPMAPLRELPEHSVGPVAQPDDRIDSSQGLSSSERTAEKPPPGKPLFKEPDFGSDGSSDQKLEGVPPREELLSPTQTRA